MRIFVAFAILVFLALVPANAAVIDSLNESLAPKPTTWDAGEVGWTYTPSFDYSLEGIETKFGSVDSRIVTLEFYDEHPEDGGVLLRSGSFSPASNVFSGAVFSGLMLTAGEDYFMGFRHVLDLGVNVTEDSGATAMSPLRFSFDDNGSYDFFEPGTFTENPILRFLGTPSPPGGVIPEPSSILLLCIGLLVILIGFRKKSKRT